MSQPNQPYPTECLTLFLILHLKQEQGNETWQDEERRSLQADCSTEVSRSLVDGTCFTWLAMKMQLNQAFYVKDIALYVKPCV